MFVYAIFSEIYGIKPKKQIDLTGKNRRGPNTVERVLPTRAERALLRTALSAEFFGNDYIGRSAENERAVKGADKGRDGYFCENAEDGTNERTNVAKYFDAKQISAGRYSKEEAPSVANSEE